MKDLLVCIRCHKDPSLILDCVDAINWSCGGRVFCVCAVDGRPVVAEKLRKHIGWDYVFCSDKQWGWGAGLYSLLIQSIDHFEKLFSFSHFLSVDYDTLFIQRDGDLKILSYISDPKDGLIGAHSISNTHWAVRFDKERSAFQEIFGKVPATYCIGEGVQGGCMLLTRALILKMRQKGMFLPPYSVAKEHTSIADDHLLPIFVRMCGMNIVNAYPAVYSEWRATKDPRNHGDDVFLFHPTKIRPECTDGKLDREIRNHFRKIRGSTRL